MMKDIKLFCENIFNYQFLQNIDKKNKKQLIKFCEKSLEKYDDDKSSIYYRRAFAMYTIFTNSQWSYKFFFSIFNQPYLNNYVFSSDLKEIKSFINSENLYNTSLYIKLITSYFEEFNYLTFKIINSTNAVCISPRWFYTYKNSEFTIINKTKKNKYNNTISKINGFTFLTDLDTYIINKTNDRQLLRNKINYLLKNKIKTDEQTKKCVNDAKNGLIRFIYYEISWIIENIDELKYFEKSSCPMLHRSNIILDFLNYKDTKIVNVLSMESSISQGNLNWIYVDKLLLDSIKNDIEVNLGLKCNIITFEIEECPIVNIQGNIGTCAIWSLYFFYLYTFYPSRKEIFSMLKNIDIKSRNDILLFFIFFVYKNCKQFIKPTKRIPAINIDIELRNNCNLII